MPIEDEPVVWAVAGCLFEVSLPEGWEPGPSPPAVSLVATEVRGASLHFRFRAASAGSARLTFRSAGGGKCSVDVRIAPERLRAESTDQGGAMDTIELRSPAFGDHTEIPPRFSRDGDDLSPPLEWTDVPAGTAELVLLCEDPDAPGGTWVHWVVTNLDPELRSLDEGKVPGDAVEGANDYGGTGYGGPQPPIGDRPHRYFFRLFAVGERLDVQPGASAEDVRRAMAGKELAEGTLVGTFRR
ncbi:MAG TPA: YbhB/YbcL family Raf kinase inhibitor-like protein [Acidimicrobiales bacterium]|nr:YbhB/YbcL family Raf kinase inhibitor-like protein [Acidimicrobiales bacterium]